MCSGSLSGPVALSGVMARLARCHLSRHLHSCRLSPICRMTTSRAGRTTSPGMKVPLRWVWDGAQWARCQPVVGGGGSHTFCLQPPGFSLPAGSGGGAGASREAAAGAEAAAQLRPEWRFVPGRLVASAAGTPLEGPCLRPPPAPVPLCPPSPGHHQGPLPEGEVQPAQGVRGAGLPARHVHQPQEAGAQVGVRRGRGRAGGRRNGGPRRGLSTLSPRAGSSRWAPRRTGAASPATPPRWPPSAAPTAIPTARR